ncbi:MAG: ACT domain-containing protein [Candidatus Thorarchaeota archaeon]
MSGETNLDTLLKHMKPVVQDGEYVFCVVSENKLEEIETPKMIFREPEGTTVIVTKDIAERNSLDYSSSWGLITLSIHSALEAEGFLAAITAYLAKSKISVNAVSAYYHDHLFVPYSKVQDALQILERIPDTLES